MVPKLVSNFEKFDPKKNSPKLTLIAGAPGAKDARGFLELLTTLRQKKEIFVKLGIAVYQKIRQVQGSGKIRKGSIVDEKM